MSQTDVALLGTDGTVGGPGGSPVNPSVGGGAAVGNPVSGATPGTLLGVDSSGKLQSGPVSSSVVLTTGAGTVFDPAGAGRGAASALLRYAPPQQFNPTVVDLTSTPGNYYATLTAGADYIFKLSPTVTRTGLIEVDANQARHIRIIGGKWALNDANGGPFNYHIHFHNVAGSVFVEGQEVDMTNTHADFLDAGGSTGVYPSIFWQNSRVLNLNATDATNHADFFQPQNPVGYCYIDKITGSSNYQAFTIASDGSMGSVVPNGVFFSRINLWYSAANATDPNTSLFWLNNGGGGGQDTQPYPIVFEDTWIDLSRGAGRSGYSGNVNLALYPNVNSNSATGNNGYFAAGEHIGAADASDHSYASYPDPNMLVRGVVRSGSPPIDEISVFADTLDGLGSYVQAGVGYEYQSPGYLLHPGVDFAI